MSTRLRTLLVVMILAFSGGVSAEAISQGYVNILILGSSGGNVFYMSFDEGFTEPCQDGLIYCPSTNDDCKNMYGIALTAKSTGKQLYDVWYDRDLVTTDCTLTDIAVE